MKITTHQKINIRSKFMSDGLAKIPYQYTGDLNSDYCCRPYTYNQHVDKNNKRYFK